MVYDKKLRTQLLKNYCEEHVLIVYRNLEADSLSSAINKGFQWSKTKQGQRYWDKIFNKATRWNIKLKLFLTYDL